MYEYLKCDCCGYVPDEYDMAQDDYYYLQVCHHCGRKVCPYCLVTPVGNIDNFMKLLDDDDEDDRRWRFRCMICNGILKDKIRGFRDSFPIWRALKLPAK